ncbi:PAS domain-containing protein [Fictibacillus enclensis]|uniref:PAS domain-containing protein n=1 Tax=Fictibacillus enclensis TaxID=1017270 RepID=UPI0024C03C2D|nr:PAS domain-containing protein [Fictibacillus enclensis]WHY73471.1 PAS domain-containing protein [Fictibacillus enclensis]
MKQNLNLFKEKVSLLEKALDFTRVGITITDPSLSDNPIIYVNEGFLSMAGYEYEEVIGKNCRFLQGEDTDKDSVREIKEALQDKKKISIKLRNYRKDGTPFWNDLTIDPFYMEEEGKYYFIGIQNDITKQEEYQERLEITLKEIDRLSTPLVPVTDNTLVLPLIGNLSRERFEKITEIVVSDTNVRHATYLILDLSGLGMFDDHTSSLIFQLHHLIKLLGTDLVLTGISAQLAMKAGTSHELYSLKTYLSVQEAINDLSKI